MRERSVIGKEVWKALIDKNMTLKRFAELAGLSTSFVSSILYGRRPMSLKFVAACKVYLGLDLYPQFITEFNKKSQQDYKDLIAEMRWALSVKGGVWPSGISTTAQKPDTRHKIYVEAKTEPLARTAAALRAIAEDME